MATWIIALIVIGAVVVVALLVASAVAARRRRTLRARFGPEYDHAVAAAPNRRAAERELRGRAARREQLEIRPLSPASAERYRAQWRLVQERFVDAPTDAVGQAHALLTTVMGERGYPTTDGDERTAMLSVDHADVVTRYRTAAEIETRSRSGQATTEALRQAMQHYRALFDQLVDDVAEAYPGDTTVANQPEGASERVSARRGSPAGPAG